MKYDPQLCILLNAYADTFVFTIVTMIHRNNYFTYGYNYLFDIICHHFQIACAFVAALLHYLFTAVFFWMLCEGIMLYLMLVVVFSQISKKWWIFFIIGWGKFYFV